VPVQEHLTGKSEFKMSNNVPILFLTFNRFDTTKIVFERIKEHRPKTLYVASDGARLNKPGEEEQVEKIRLYLTDQIDWECNVKTLFRKNNLGCKNAVSGAISWFFENEEMGIILEDDCLPSKSFFPFCEELLLKYKDDDRIMHIDGTTSQDGVPGTSYQFSKYCLIWGWATWRRAWNKYDVGIKSFPEFKEKNIIKSIWRKQEVSDYWLKNFRDVYSGQVNTWDYQWAYTVWTNNGMSIRPAVNLIKNIGFNAGATHTHDANELLKTMKNKEIVFPLHHPVFFLPNIEMDDICSSNHFDIHKPYVNITKRVLQKVKTLFHN
jgi:hypothetical protein